MEGMTLADQKLLLTDIQFAYLVGRDSNMYLGGNATHGYMELEGNADPDRIEDALYKVMELKLLRKALTSTISTALILRK